MLRNKWSTQQISGTLKAMFPHHPEFQVSHETVYKAIYAQPHGELRKELITCLRQGHTKRRPVPAGLIVANKFQIWSASTCDRRKSKNGCCLCTGKAT